MRAIIEDFKTLFVNDLAIEIVNLSRATYKEASQLKKNLDDLIKDNQKKIIVDISQCEFIDSTFIGVLVVTWRKLKAEGGKLKLVKPGYFAQSVLHLSGAVENFESYGSVEEALSSFHIPIQDYIKKTTIAPN